MALKEEMDSKIYKFISKWNNTKRKQMFGGFGYYLNGNMVAGIHGKKYVLRLGVDMAKTAIKLPLFKNFKVSGKIRKGWVIAEPDAFSDENLLQEWLKKAKSFLETLPPR
ncbi:MAG: TfoX/Sxy family protein [Promethearchaeota archaeon]|jgi:TfoX/Sxy family transcriptional regulator of competence genes